MTFIAIKLLGQSFNLMTLGGLAAAVGLVIDDAIVVVENIVLHRDAGQDRLQAIHSALREITIPLIGSTITPIVVFVPLIAMTGVTGTSSSARWRLRVGFAASLHSHWRSAGRRLSASTSSGEEAWRRGGGGR